MRSQPDEHPRPKPEAPPRSSREGEDRPLADDEPRTVLARLRDGALISRDAVVVVAVAMALASVVVILRLLWLAPGFVDATGAPVAHDFSLFYAAGRLVRAAGPAAIYDLARLGAEAKALFGPKAFVAVWPYPPPMAVVMATLAGFSYRVALGLWLIVPIAALLGWVWWATRSRFGVIVVAGAPVLFLNTVVGQAGPVFTLLLAAGALAAARGAALGGAPLGLMALKPHLAVLAPFAFASAKAWRAIALAAGIAAAIVLASLWAHGLSAWSAWLDALREAGRLTAVAEVDSRLPSVQAAMRMFGANATLAIAVQAAVALAVVAVVAVVWRGDASPWDKAAILLLGAPLVPPYLWFYDCLTGPVAAALIVARADAEGFRPWERLALGALWLSPLANLIALGPVAVPAMTIAGLFAFAAVARGIFRRH